MTELCTEIGSERNIFGGNKPVQDNVVNTLLATAASVVVTLIVTLVFNKVVALPAAIKAQKAAQQKEIDDLKAKTAAQEVQIEALQAQVDKLPTYREKSKEIQDELHAADEALLATCQAIQNSMVTMQTNLQSTLSNLEVRQIAMQKAQQELQEGQDQARVSLSLLESSKKDELRIQLIDQYHLFANPSTNPCLAWSEMEYHAFHALLSDYESLGGNDYVHGTVVPAMDSLEIVRMSNMIRLEEVMQARHVHRNTTNYKA